MPRITPRPCQDCGKVVPMYPTQLRCKICSYTHQLQKARERYYHPEKSVKSIADREVGRNWPVKFLEKDGGFIWQVSFWNEKTRREVKIGAAKVFPDMDTARADYVKAMR